jgi:hypothetical protein
MLLVFPMHRNYKGMMYVTQMNACIVRTHMCLLVYMNAQAPQACRHYCTCTVLYNKYRHCTVLYAHIIYTVQIAVLCRLLRRHVLYLNCIVKAGTIFELYFMCVLYTEQIADCLGGVRAKSYDGEKAWSSINHSILFGLTLF